VNPKALLFLAATMLSSTAMAATNSSLWDLLAKTDYIQVGTSGPIAYDFFDPNCPYCAMTYKAEQPYIRTGELRIRYVPVGFITPESLAKAAAILTSKNPAIALALNFQPMPKAAQGAIPPLAHVPLRVKFAILANQDILAKVGIQIVPDLFYQTKQGRLEIIRGIFPPYVLQDVADGTVPQVAHN